MSVDEIGSKLASGKTHGRVGVGAQTAANSNNFPERVNQKRQIPTSQRSATKFKSDEIPNGDDPVGDGTGLGGLECGKLNEFLGGFVIRCSETNEVYAGVTKADPPDCGVKTGNSRYSHQPVAK